MNTQPTDQIQTLPRREMLHWLFKAGVGATVASLLISCEEGKKRAPDKDTTPSVQRIPVEHLGCYQAVMQLISVAKKIRRIRDNKNEHIWPELATVLGDFEELEKEVSNNTYIQFPHVDKNTKKFFLPGVNDKDLLYFAVEMTREDLVDILEKNIATTLTEFRERIVQSKVQHFDSSEWKEWFVGDYLMFALEIIQARGGSHNQSLWFETCTSDKKIKEKLEKGLGIVFITSGLFKISQE